MNHHASDASRAIPPDVHRRALLVAALGFVLLGTRDDAGLRGLHRWLCTWNGVGLVAAGMHRQGFDLSLTQYDDRGWRATFHVTGMVHSITAGTGSAFAATPWLATHGAAWDALDRERRLAG